jgi:hypothetical protein
VRDAVIGTIGMNLITAELSLLQTTSDQNSPTGGVNFYGVTESLLQRKAEKLLQHLNDIVVTVVVIVQENDIEKRRLFSLMADVCFFLGNCLRH